MKIKANDDRILATAAAVLLLSRERWGRGETGPGMIGAALAEYRDDYDGFKARFPKRDLAAAKDLAGMVEHIKSAALRTRYQELIEAMDVVLARIARGKIQFNSLLELDNYFVANLRRFDAPPAAPGRRS